MDSDRKVAARASKAQPWIAKVGPSRLETGNYSPHLKQPNKSQRFLLGRFQ
jgi:hypothetical protein